MSKILMPDLSSPYAECACTYAECVQEEARCEWRHSVGGYHLCGWRPVNAGGRVVLDLAFWGLLDSDSSDNPGDSTLTQTNTAFLDYLNSDSTRGGYKEGAMGAISPPLVHVIFFFDNEKGEKMIREPPQNEDGETGGAFKKGR